MECYSISKRPGGVILTPRPVKRKLESTLSRSVFFLAASTFALAACQPASEAPATLEAEIPPVIEEPAEADVVGVAADATEDTAATAADDESEDHDGEDHEDHGEEDHDDAHEDHDHDDHGDEADDHDHDEHDHDDHGDEDHDHAGGEAHVHGLSDLAASIDGATLSVSVEGALANFDLDETIRELEDTTPYSDSLIEIVGGDCVRNDAQVGIRPIGDHGNLMVDLTYTCSAPGDISGIEVTGFQTFAGFEEVNAVYLTDAGQIAETLTESDTRLDIS